MGVRLKKADRYRIINDNATPITTSTQRNPDKDGTGHR
jgi:hypothetical protein